MSPSTLQDVCDASRSWSSVQPPRPGISRSMTNLGTTASSVGVHRLADVISARNLTKRYGERRVLDRVEFELPPGGFLLVTGPNGSGKTTLLRLCAGLL